MCVSSSEKPFERLCRELMIGFGDAHIIQCHTKIKSKSFTMAGPRTVERRKKWFGCTHGANLFCFSLLLTWLESFHFFLRNIVQTYRFIANLKFFFGRILCVTKTSSCYFSFYSVMIIFFISASVHQHIVLFPRFVFFRLKRKKARNR